MHAHFRVNSAPFRDKGGFRATRKQPGYAPGRGISSKTIQSPTLAERKLLPREEKFSTTEKECLAIKLSIQAFNVYLMGRTFIIETDHRSLEWLDRIKHTNARLTRWSLFLQSYSYSVKYRQGTVNGNADGLSRAC